MKLGIQIAQARRRSGIAQKDLAARCACTVQAISQVELGRVLPRKPRMLIVMAELLGVSTEALLERIDSEQAERLNLGKRR